MKLFVISDTVLAFEVCVEHEGKLAEGKIEMVPNGWTLTRQKGSIPLPAPQLYWSEALKRGIDALVYDLVAGDPTP